ncbi:hypothetical protein Poli38472_006866 [Pythium oligandrum]|uniref:Uncharacterized protein n=1 Tax=Pythium oligandrum TaxID=41045 RepID=A0A8K1C5C3_PYTOL|nr:hypothetical protein Poli38472_006866 [Pythium oligandrum]|eukprot:TMW56856.1 hypothetical protein Poli38472_006866 [Pythium oligandrum]
MLADAKETWRWNPYKVLLDLQESRLQLQEFGATKGVLDQAIQAFIDRISTSLNVFLERAASVDAAYSIIAHEVELVTVYGLLSLLGLCGTALGLGFVAVVTGVITNKRSLARTTCFFGQITCIIALILTGVLYTMAMMAHDGIVSLQLLDAGVSIFVEPEQAAIDITRVLFDANLVQSTGMKDTVEFSDTLHVPPHPTPYNDKPDRVNIDALYDFPELFDLADQARQLPSARNAFFGWEEAFLTEQYDFLYVLAYGNDTVESPYTQPIHQELLKSTAARIMDPDQDSHLVTNDDLAYIESVLNEAWRGLSDHGVEQNEKIGTQWLFVARLELQKMRLDTYLTTIADIITRPKPMLSDLNQKTSAMEDAEFQLKAPVEFFTNAIRASKINDCSYDNNCGWFRDVLKHLFDHFQQIIVYAEYAAICCAISTLAMLLGVICIGCFASRLRRNIVKVYSAT